MSVTALFTDVVLDDAAIQAERLALLTELTAERFGCAVTRAGTPAASAELAAAQHLEQAASLAREAADRERTRCASVPDVSQPAHAALARPPLPPPTAPDSRRRTPAPEVRR